MFLSSLLNHFTNRLLLSDYPTQGLLRLLLLVGLPLGIPLCNLAMNLFYDYVTLFGKFIIIFLLIYFLGLISAFTSAVSYIKDIYEQETDRIPFRYFLACFFGLFPPKINVSNNMQESPWQEMVEKIGGPVFLNIPSGFAVLTETLTAPANVYGQGRKHFITRQERIYEVIDLHEQEGTVKNINATTKDGIEVVVENVKYNYRVWDSRWDGLYKDRAITRNPFPYSKQAIYNYAYNRSVQSDKQGKLFLASWASVVSGRVQGIIKDYINQHKLDDVIAYREHEKKDPREEIRSKAYHPAFKDSLRSVGTLLRWWDPGEFKSQKDVEDQFLSNWSVDLVSNVQLNRAYGEAQKLAYEELGRAEAEAELLMSIIQALDGIRFSADKVQTLQNLILMRTAQVIKALNTPTSAAQPSDAQHQQRASDNLESQ